MKQSEIKEAKRTLAQIYHDWQAEDREIERRVDELRRWMYEVSQLGDPHFGETATRLGPMRQRLLVHFEREDEMISEIAASHRTSARKVNMMRRQSSADRDQLIEQLDDLAMRLNELDPPFVSWQRAVDEVETLVHSLEAHEARESERMTELLPSSELD